MAKLNQIEQLKLNVTNIQSFLVKSNKDKKKLNTERESREKKKLSFEKQKKEEQKLKLNKKPKSEKSAEQVIELSSMSLLDKLFNLGGLLLGGILINAADSILKEGKKFYRDNKELFDTIGTFLSGVKDAAVELLDSFTGPYSEEGAFDDFAKFDDNGKLRSGTLKKIEDAYNGLGDLINTIDKALGGKGNVGNMIKTNREELVNQTERRSGLASFREDPAENAALQQSVRNRSTSPTTSPTSPSSGKYSALFTTISGGEGGVDSYNTGTAGVQSGYTPPKAISKMTVGEIMSAQASEKLYAVGKYQIIPETMRGFVNTMGISGQEIFNEATQEKFTQYVVDHKRPQVGEFLRGEKGSSLQKAQLALAAEFASIGVHRDMKRGEYAPTSPIGPIPPQDIKKGQSLYRGIGGNRAHISPDLIAALLTVAAITPKPPKVKPVPNKKNNQARLINQKDPRKKRSSTIIALQRVNNTQVVPFPVPVPVKSKSFSAPSQTNLSPLWGVV